MVWLVIIIIIIIIYFKSINISNNKVSEVLSYFKHSDSKSSDQFLKLQNNFASSQSRSSRTQKDFDFNLTITHEEFNRGLISFENY
jgi:hypothetical protein